MERSRGKDRKKKQKQTRKMKQETRLRRMLRWEAWADSMPSIIVGVSIARISVMIGRVWPEETDLLFVVVVLLALFVYGLQSLLRFLFLWEDYRIDVFEHASVRPFVFMQSFFWFLAVQFGLNLLDRTMTSFTAPLLPHFLHLCVVFLSILFFLLPFWGRVSERGLLGSDAKKLS